MPKLRVNQTRRKVTVSIRFVTAVLIAATSIAFAGSDEVSGTSSSNSSVIFVIDGTKVTLADFERQHPVALFQARNTFFEAEKKAIEEYVDEFLLQQQAKKEGVTVPQLLEAHVNNSVAKVPTPSDEALRIYYEGLDTAESFDAVKDKIVEHLRDRRIAKAKTAYMQSLRSQAKIEMKLTPPRAEVSLVNTPVRGASDPVLTLVEYADYECPYCQQIQPDLNKLEAAYKGKIAFAYKDVPLPMHTHAQKAAEAAHCAGVQTKYWEYHDLLLSSKELEVPQLKGMARQLKLDGAAFDKCLDSGQEAGLVKDQLAEAQKLGIQGTPSFFLNGRFFSGALTFDNLRQAAEEEMKRSANQPNETAQR
jgi:protein-disulfide isomerase